MRNPQVTQIEAPHTWARYLIHGITDGLGQADIAEIEAWAAEHGVKTGHCCNASDDIHPGDYVSHDGQRDVITYLFIAPHC